MLFRITKILGLGIICLFAIGLAAEATVKISIGLLMVGFWGLVLLGLWALYEQFSKR